MLLLKNGFRAENLEKDTHAEVGLHAHTSHMFVNFENTMRDFSTLS